MQRGGLILRQASRALQRAPSLPAATRRQLRGSAAARHGYAAGGLDAATAVRVVFVGRDGGETAVLAPPGKNLLEIAHANEVDLEGACEGSLACSTCHVYLEPNVFDRLPEPDDDENDMLDLAFGLTEQ
jgi:ferredoxin-2, mitochondrial